MSQIPGLGNDIRKALYKKSLADYITYINQGYWQRARHLDLLCHALEDVAAGKTRRLMVFMPPRHGKSEVVSKAFPSWYLCNHPDAEMIISSYGASLAYGFSRKARDFVRDYGEEIFGIKLATDSSAVERWGLEGHRGCLNAAGVDGPITGKGANIAIIDDPHKDLQSVQSKAQRDSVYEWYQSVLRLRLAPNGSIVLVQTRWSDDDLAGRLLRDMGDGHGEKWEVISFPAIATEHDILGRQEGEALWPERYSLSELNELRRLLSPSIWTSLYQQSPTQQDGDLFRRQFFRYYDHTGDTLILHTFDNQTAALDKKVPLSSCWVFQTVDTAATENEKSDYFAAATWAVTPSNDLVLLDMFREKAETIRHMQIMENLWQNWHPKFQAVENKTFGLNIIQALKAAGRPVVPLKADADKYSRALPISARYQIGAVYHPRQAVWLGDYEDELIKFPNGEHDDMVDVASYAAIVLSSKAKKEAHVSKFDLASLGF